MKGTSLETALEKVSRILSKQYGLRLVCEGDRCMTDGRTIYLPSLPDDVPEELVDAIRGWADHEASHAIYTNTRMATPFREKHGQQAFDILNGLEDARVERLNALIEADYEGEHYLARVVDAPQFKSGKAVRILSGPASGEICRSPTGAMLKATEAQREEQGLGRKGVANGWGFWIPKEGAP